MEVKRVGSSAFTIILLGLLFSLLLFATVLVVAGPALSAPATEVTITATDPTAAEAGTNPGAFTITRSATAGSLVVNLQVAPASTATSGSDYEALPTTVTLASGTPSVTLAVTPIDDDVQEGDETVIVSIEDDPDYTVGSPSSDTVTILGDPISIRASDPVASEWGPNLGMFTVTRVDPQGGVAVEYTIGGSADNGIDYEPLSGSVTLPSGSLRATITVIPIDDVAQEGRETVVLTLIEDPDKYRVGPSGSATVTIGDDDEEIRIAADPIGRPWLYLFDPASGRLFRGPSTTGEAILYFDVNKDKGEGRIFRGANTTGAILFTVSFRTGRVWVGPRESGPLLYTLESVQETGGPEVQVHLGNAKGPMIYHIEGDKMRAGGNVTGPLVFHGSEPFWGPVQFLLPFLAEGRIP